MSEQAKKNKQKRSPALMAGLVLLFLAIVILVTLAMFASFDEVTNVFIAGKVDIVLTEPAWDVKNGDDIVPNTFIGKDPRITNKEETVDTYVFMKVTVPYDDDPALVIEYAHQDTAANGLTKSGQVAYSNSQTRRIIPLYEFVATGVKSNPGEDTTTGTRNYNMNFGISNVPTYYTNTNTNSVSNYANSSVYQKVNPGWYLLNGYPQIDTSSHTITYLYAHVKNGTDELMPLKAGFTTEYPLFNEIYYLNFRERAGVATATPPVTPFPDRGRDASVHIEAYGIQSNFLKENNTTTAVPEEVWKYIDQTYVDPTTTP